MFFPEGAYGPTNNCVGIGDVLRRRGHEVVFIVEESFTGTLESKGFAERLMRLASAPEAGSPAFHSQETALTNAEWGEVVRDCAAFSDTPLETGVRGLGTTIQ